jgi:2-phospho-L-lactate guanylyltransferase
VVTAIVPIRSFHGMTRLSNELTPDERYTLSRWLADSVMEAVLGAGLKGVVVSDDPAVRTWAQSRGADTASDRGSGLSDSVSAAVGDLRGGSWIAIHADLPLIQSGIVAEIARTVDAGKTVICPSLDGGTNVIGAHGPFEFSYGPGSFTRHLAKLRNAKIWIDRSTALEVDTIEHYLALSTLGFTPSLAS